MNDKTPLSTVENILPHLKFIRNKKQEYFVCLSLDSGYRLIKRRVVTVGLLDRVMAHPREVFAGPLQDRAAYVIVAHNHPSGDPEPSGHDIALTQQLAAAGQILGVSLRNHIIVALDDYYAFDSLLF
jgi:DNA repair protein RadC